MSPDDEQTKAEARRVHPLYEARMKRLDALAQAMGARGVALDEATLREIRDGLKRIDRGSK